VTLISTGLSLHLRLDQTLAIAQAGPQTQTAAAAGAPLPFLLYVPPPGTPSNNVPPVVASAPPTVPTAPPPAPGIPPVSPSPSGTPATSPPSVVPDDTFGGSLSFDGVAAAGVALDPTSVPTGAALTLTIWANGGAALPKNCSIFEALDANRLRTVNVHLPYGDGVVYFDCGNDGTVYDRVAKAATAEEYKGSWAHWAFVKDATAGSMTIYRNGSVWASATGTTRTIPASASAALGASLDDAMARWAGRVANLRMYARALSGDDVRAVMAEDQAALASFRQSYPVDVAVYDDETDQPVLSITNDAAGRTLRVDLRNAGEKALHTLPAPAPTPSATSFHLALRLRPGTLAPAFLASASSSLAALPGTPSWVGSAATEPDGTQTIYLVCTGTASLDLGQLLSIRIPGVSADGTGGAHGTRVEADYRNFAWSDDPTPVIGTRLIHLDVLNAFGPAQQERRSPLHLGFVGSRTVLNDGRTANTLLLRVTNARLSDPLVLNPATAAAPTRFLLTFDTQPQGGPERDWALGTTDQVAAITPAVAPNPASWSVASEPADNPQWALVPTGPVTLSPGDSFTVTLAPIVTGLPDGETTAYVTYENVPGFPDGQVMLPIIRSRIVVKDGKVGLGRVPQTDVDLGRSAVSGTVIDLARAQATMTGGDGAQWLWNGTAGSILWSSRLIAFGNLATFPQAYVQIPFPPANTPIRTWQGDTRNSTATGIPLNMYEALYAVFDPAVDQTVAALRIVRLSTGLVDPAATAIPSNYLHVAGPFHPDTHTIRFGAGSVLDPTAVAPRRQTF